MSKTLAEWIEKYNKKIPEGFKRDERFELFYLPEKGFCELRATEHLILVGQVSGDGRFWKSFAEELARTMGYKKCGTICERENVSAYIRLFGFSIDKCDEENGLKRYYGTDKNGKHGIMTECVFENNHHAYLVSWEVK